MLGNAARFKSETQNALGQVLSFSTATNKWTLQGSLLKKVERGDWDAYGVYGAYGGVTAGPEEATDALVGSASAGAGIGLALADVSLEGTKAIPIIGNIVSAGTLAWDGYQAYQKYQSCMAGH